MLKHTSRIFLVILTDFVHPILGKDYTSDKTLIRFFRPIGVLIVSRRCANTRLNSVALPTTLNAVCFTRTQSLSESSISR